MTPHYPKLWTQTAIESILKKFDTSDMAEEVFKASLERDSFRSLMNICKKYTEKIQLSKNGAVHR